MPNAKCFRNISTSDIGSQATFFIHTRLLVLSYYRIIVSSCLSPWTRIDGETGKLASRFGTKSNGGRVSAKESNRKSGSFVARGGELRIPNCEFCSMRLSRTNVQGSKSIRLPCTCTYSLRLTPYSPYSLLDIQ